MWSLSRHKRALAAAAAAASLLLLPSTSAAEPGPYPGIPHLEPAPGFPTAEDRNITAWLNAPYTGLAGSVRAMQWSRIPLGTLASNIAIFSCVGPDYTGTPAPACTFPTPPGMTGPYTAYDIQAFLVSPDGSEQPYGYGQIMTVRSLAFGAIPVEIDLQVSQERDASGLPLPIHLNAADYRTGPLGGAQTDYVTMSAVSSGRVMVGVEGLRVDGVTVDLAERCSTPPLDLVARSEEARVPTSDILTLSTRRHALGTDGGGVSGFIDIPAFNDCVTGSGDDVSPILTTALSAPGNPVFMQYGAAYCFRETTEEGFFKPTPPGADTPAEAGCTQYQLAPAKNPDNWAIPLPWDFPDYAPGAPAP